MSTNLATEEKILEVDFAFERFISEHGRDYKTKEEFAHRRMHFKKAYKEIMHRNSYPEKTPLTLTKFADWTDEEKKGLLGYISNAPSENHVSEMFQSYGAIDWRQRGIFNPVRDQALGGASQCGSCWAFSTIASIESHYAIKYNQLPNLSEQQLVDCTPGSDCRGGYYDAAYRYVMSAGAEYGPGYPYVGQT